MYLLYTFVSIYLSIYLSIYSQNSLSQSLYKCVIFQVWIEVFPFTYEAGPKQNEVKLQGSASSALGNIQYTYVRTFMQSSRALVWKFWGGALPAPPPAATPAPPAPAPTARTNQHRLEPPALSPATLLIYYLYNMTPSAPFLGRAKALESLWEILVYHTTWLTEL